MQVAGKGTLKISLSGINYTITNVYYVPDLKNNLLSIGQLQERGLTILFKGNKCCIYHPRRGLIIQSTISANRMYTLSSETQDCEEPVGNYLQVPSADMSKLWH
ncbi:hypothetical protein LIER_31001 [Lithospermum erythrorhizon]|uniref:Retrovirus-related Pol polyprotein from transposon TNT 1-94-like beta-barrel domain-containing protein n=1 Tax=Lithospermum erythrorhizon TaxID=34254 RepID=A0AAV3RRF2_LITER